MWEPIQEITIFCYGCRNRELNFSSEFLFQLIALLLQHFDLNFTYFLSSVSIIFFILFIKL